MFVCNNLSKFAELLATKHNNFLIMFVLFFFIYIFFAWYNSSYGEKGGVEGVEAEEVVEISLDSTLF